MRAWPANFGFSGLSRGGGAARGILRVESESTGAALQAAFAWA
jgi:hypothetical protein